MSRKGNCWDNAPTESDCWDTQARMYPPPELSDSSSGEAIHFRLYRDGSHHRKRRHSALGSLSPLAFEHRTRKEPEANV